MSKREGKQDKAKKNQQNRHKKRDFSRSLLYLFKIFCR